MKKKIAIIFIIIIIAILALCIFGGFKKRTDVVLNSYMVSKDETKIKLKVMIASSMGYVRDLKVKQDENNKYITFYSTFGILNSKIGAKNEFEVELNPECEEIYFYKGNGEYNLVLKKDQETNEWRRPKRETETGLEETGFEDIGKEFPVEEAIEKGYFVIDSREEKIYNKEVLDRFIKNTEIDATNRIADKMRIADYNIDGEPTIIELEYKILDETYKNKDGQKVNKTTYIITKDSTRNSYGQYTPNGLEVNDNIPGEYYGIKVIENPEFSNVKILFECNEEGKKDDYYDDIEIENYIKK